MMHEHAHIENPGQTYLVKIRTAAPIGGPVVLKDVQELYPDALQISVETIPHDQAEYVSVMGEVRPL